jgi:hypothetical protein
LIEGKKDRDTMAVIVFKASERGKMWEEDTNFMSHL